MNNKRPLISSLLSEFASELAIELLIDPEYGYAGRIKTKDGKVFYYRGTKFDINSLGASEIAKDKAYASYFMSQLGYPVPVGDSFYSDYWCEVINSSKNAAAAIKFAEKIGFPVIVKPNSESQGRGVEKVYTQDELVNALSFILDDIKDKVVLVQSVAQGKDYRIVVLHDEVLCAYLRTPLSLIGNGKSTIYQLLEEKQQQFIEQGNNAIINPEDARISRTLSHQKLTFSSVLPEGQQTHLLANANLSSGGEAKDVTSHIHPDYKKMAVTLTKDMGLRFCGIDIMTSLPISEPIGNYVVIEINAAPGLDYYAETGEKQREIVKNLYKKIVTSLIQQ